MTSKQLLDTIPIPPLPECGEYIENKLYRLKCYYHKLEISKLPTTAELTLTLINSTLDEVEDCYSGVTAEPNPSKKYSGRMYTIQDDYIERKQNGGMVALTKGNRIIIEANGEFSILDRNSDELLLEKKHE